MCCVTANSTTERLLIGSVFLVYVVTQLTFLGGIGTLHTCRVHTTLGGIPNHLIGNMAEIGRPHVSVHRSGFVAHGGDRKLFVSELTAFVFLKANIDGPVNLLPHMTDEPLPRRARCGRQLFFRHAFLFLTLPDLRLPAAPFTVSLLSLS